MRRRKQYSGPVAIGLLSDHPEFQELVKECHEAEKHFEEQLDFLDKRKNDLLAEAQSRQDHISQRCDALAVELGLIKEEDLETHKIEIYFENNTITLQQKQKDHREKCNCPTCFLRSLLGAD